MLSLRRRPAVVPAGLAVCLILSACATDRPSTPAASPFVSVAGQPANVGDVRTAALAYRSSGSYDRDLTRIAAEAGRWLAERAAATARPALVLDIDETALSNWEIIMRDDFGRPIVGPCDPEGKGPCGWAAWDQLGRDPAIGPTLALFRQARAAGVSVFFITGRPENQRAATERNLAAAGYGGYTKLAMVPDGSHFASAADFKAPVRAAIEREGYVIVANVGDQPSDLEGGHAERAFLLPNPFYRVP